MLPFLPRKVAQSVRKPPPQNATHVSEEAKPIPPQPSTSHATPVTSIAKGDNKGKGKGAQNTLNEEDCAILVCLSLSDYATWLNPDLARAIGMSDEGYIPVRQLLQTSAVFTGLQYPPSETAVARAVRLHAKDSFDVRMIISAPSRPTWNRGDDSSVYEIRKRDSTALSHTSQISSKHEWDSLTIYVENIPHEHRSIPGIARFMRHLLNVGDQHVSDPLSSIQQIVLPPHHQDKEGDQPKCKGFALVTVTRTEDVEELLRRWPWHPRRADLLDLPHSDVLQNALRSGCRMLSKARWDQLGQEYLAYGQSLLNQMTHTQNESGEETATIQEDDDADTSRAELPPVAPKIATPPFDLSAPYPQGCLVFVRNVHPETNKTTLRTLFSRAYSESEPSGDIVDYVDFTKGSETCYLRLTSPRHTQLLLAHFDANPMVQTEGLDNAGTQSSTAASRKAISIELVDGTREEIYWAKVPEKVRRQAVEKAVGHIPADTNGRAPAGKGQETGQTGRKRKRRKVDNS